MHLAIRYMYSCDQCRVRIFSTSEFHSEMLLLSKVLEFRQYLDGFDPARLRVPRVAVSHVSYPKAQKDKMSTISP